MMDYPSVPITDHSKTDRSKIGRHPASAQVGPYRLPPSARVGRVRLAVSDLERSVDFYSQVIGLAVLNAGTSEARLARLGPHGGKTILLELEEIPGVRELGQAKRLGLYHTAFLLPTREALGSFVKHLVRRGTPFAAADHLVSEALEVEVYADRPREQWIRHGSEIDLTTKPLRLNQLVAAAENSWTVAPAITIVGHVHFYVGDLAAAESFYHTALGLDVVTRRFPGALFTSAGGYHHHVGLNTWAAGSPPASSHDPRLLFWELVLPNEAEIERVGKNMIEAGYSPTTTRPAGPAFQDPWGITVALVSP